MVAKLHRERVSASIVRAASVLPVCRNACQSESSGPEGEGGHDGSPSAGGLIYHLS